MKLHNDQALLEELIRATADYYATRDVYIEKDYWVTYALKNLFTSDVADKVVFKGGTSLSKGYGIIERFSEDVDLALVPKQGRSGARVKRLLREITSIAGSDLKEDTNTPGEKHGRIRKVYYVYPRQVDGRLMGQVGDRLLIEANAFSRPQPNDCVELQSYISAFLRAKKESSLLMDMELESFQVRVLQPEKTLAEKVIALVKASFQQNPISALRQRIRHAYDIHQLLIMDRVKEFCWSEDFFEQLKDTLEDDSLSPIGNKDWLQQDFTECLFFHAPEKFWPQLSSVYNTDFKEMMFGPLPPEDSVVKTLAFVGSRLADFDKQK